MRRDARERREALISAAAECFARAGFAVPLEEIAERAGVGRGTLYRNFKDRMAIAIAIFEREVDRFEQSLDVSLSLEQTLARLARDGVIASSLFARLANELPFDGESFAAFEALGRRLATMLDPVAERARAAGDLRPGLSGVDLKVAIRMIGGLLRPPLAPAQIEAEIAGALRLLLDGLRPK